MSQIPINIWQLSTDARFNRWVRPAPAYLTPEQAARWQRITQARMLYRGEHFAYYVLQGRSQFEFQDVEVDGERRKLYIPFNLLKRICHSSADLLFGDEPIIRTADEIQQAKLNDLAERTDLHAVFIELEVECSFAGEAVLEACIDDGEVYLVLVPAEQIHPIGAMRPDRQYAAYVRYAEANVGTPEKPINLILATTYREGSIERHVFQEKVDPDREIALNQWPAFATNTPPAVQPTGIAFNTITWFPNLFLGGRVVSDFDGLLDQQDALNAKQTQVSRVLALHAAPKVIAPRAAADDDGNLRASRAVLYSDQPGDWSYLTWDAQLDAAFKDRDFVIDAMCVISETSPVLLGIDRGGAPESARAMRLRASSSIAKAKRKATLRRPLLKWALYVAQLLEQTLPGTRYNVDKPTVEPRDGLPTDESEQAQTIATLRGSQGMSIERAVALQIADPQEAEQEVARIKDEAASAAPSFMSEPPAPATTEPATQTNEPAPSDVSTEAA